MRRERLQSGFTGNELAAKLGWSQSKVSKIETGRTKPSPGDVAEWFAACLVTGDALQQHIDQARAIQVEATDWGPEGFDADQRHYQELESAASSIRIYQPEVIPGLFQTADYARRLLTMLDRFDTLEIAARATARLDRQSVLYDTSKHVEAVVTEAALRWRPGPIPIMRAQLDRLVSLSTLPSVRIGVLPWERSGNTLPGNAFVLFTLPEEKVITVETYTAEVSISNASGVTEYERVYAGHRDASLFGDQAAEFIQRVAKDFR
jgi:transcriptional regulator with XRE-family HTH domain